MKNKSLVKMIILGLFLASCGNNNNSSISSSDSLSTTLVSSTADTANNDSTTSTNSSTTQIESTGDNSSVISSNSITDSSSNNITSSSSNNTTSSSSSSVVTGLTSIDITFSSTTAPQGWTFTSIKEVYANKTLKFKDPGTSVTSPEINIKNPIKVVLNLAINSGNPPSNGHGTIKFGVEGLNSSKTVIDSDYITNSTDLPVAFGDVEFILTSENIKYIRVIYINNLSGLNIALKTIKVSNGTDSTIPDDGTGSYKVSSFSKNIQTIEYNEGCLPSTGNSKMLVVPIDFTGYEGTSSQINDLKKTFTGTDTDWESLKTYYQKSSYGKLNLDITVLDTWQRASKAPSYYNASSEEEQSERVDELIYEIFSKLETTMDLSKFDSNDDTYIDSIYLIYSYPVDYSGESIWWAWQYYYMQEDFFDGVNPYYYAWSGYDFIKEKGFNKENYNYNAHTFIHETGHMMGLEDYYDYDDTVGPDFGLSGADMMDYTIGDHNPFSKMLLGWITPTVITTKTSIQIDLAPFQNNGDFIILSNNWNNSMFGEYFILEYYTPTGLHAKDQMYTTSGIRVFHVSGSLKNYTYDGWTYEYFTNNNTDSTYKLISILEADGGSNSEVMSDSDLFIAGKTITGKYNNGTNLQYKTVVNSLNSTKAVLTITKN